MSRPGVEVSSATAAPPLGVPTDTSVAFVLAEAQMGPINKPTLLSSLDDFTATYGARVPGTYGYDALDAAFHEGLGSAYFMRIIDGGAIASVDSSTIAPNTTTKAASPGLYGNSLKLTVLTAPTTFEAQAADGEEPGGLTEEQLASPLTWEAPELLAGTFMATVSQGTTIVATSPTIGTVADLASWLNAGQWLYMVDKTTSQPPTSTAALVLGNVTPAGGTDGVVPVVAQTSVDTGLAALLKTYGPGQLLAPGRTDFATQASLLAHAATFDRFALLDGLLAGDTTSLTSAAAALRGSLQDRYGMLWAPWAVIPGLAPGTTRNIPWSAIQAGLCASVDAVGNPNQAAAGPWGQSSYALDLLSTYTEAQMQSLLYAGVNTARKVYGTIEAYGFRTLVDPAGVRSGWLEANWARLNMAIVAQGAAIGENVVFAQLDGRGHTIARFNGQLAGMLKGYYDVDALFGEDVTDAFIVSTGPSVNTPAKLAQGILSAVLSVRMSPHAELVQIAIVSYPITVALPTP